MTAPHAHRALVDCPVCGDRLVTTRLGCAGCGTELVGRFAPCPFCALSDADLDALKVFLVSRGNLKELQAHLGVSYPTARARYTDLLARLGWEAEPGVEPDGEPGPEEPGSEQEPGSEREPGLEREPGSEPETDLGPVGGPLQTPDVVRDQVLAQVASGVLSPAVAADLLGRLT